MKMEKRLLMRTLLPLAMLLLAGIGPDVRSAAAASPEWVGSWFVYICPNTTAPCTTNSPVINLASFTKDGITINADFVNPSPGIGSWVKTGHNKFVSTFFALTSLAPGVLSGMIKIRGPLTYDDASDTVSGPFRLEFRDATGRVVLNFIDGTVLLTRIAVEPLP